MRDKEIISRVGAVRDELFRQMGQFERDKVKSEDDRARGAILGIMEEMAKMATDLGALEGRMTLAEGRITRLEAKP